MRQVFCAAGLGFRLLRRRLAFLLVLSLAAALLFGLCANALAETLADGGTVTSLTLAVCGEADDRALAAELLGRMDTVTAYCRLVPMELEEARSALAAGELSAAVVLPDGFLTGILTGENPPPTLLIAEARPVEGLLARFLGEAAVSMLSDAQAGIYAVIDAYDAVHPAAPERGQMILDINFRYLQAATSRSQLFRKEPVALTEGMALGDHYALCVLCCLGMLAVSLFQPLFDPARDLSFRRYLRSAGARLPRWPGFWLCALFTAALLALPLVLLTGSDALAALTGVLSAGVFLAGLASVLGRTGSAGCAALSFLLATFCLFWGGGLLPPVLLPAVFRDTMAFDPLRQMVLTLGPALGYDPAPAMAAALLLEGAALGAVSWLLDRWEVGTCAR